ncbi:MAG: hypothetical protein LBS89_06255 [Zoogloeaceae bacterium]|jgi:hypothetical protein|nr:hypothetical protein [Zoogloeaceae bacterium]
MKIALPVSIRGRLLIAVLLLNALAVGAYSMRNASFAVLSVDHQKPGQGYRISDDNERGAVL